MEPGSPCSPTCVARHGRALPERRQRLHGLLPPLFFHAGELTQVSSAAATEQANGVLEVAAPLLALAAPLRACRR